MVNIWICLIVSTVKLGGLCDEELIAWVDCLMRSWLLEVPRWYMSGGPAGRWYGSQTLCLDPTDGVFGRRSDLAMNSLAVAT